MELKDTATSLALFAAEKRLGRAINEMTISGWSRFC